jgi:hypothetical protein
MYRKFDLCRYCTYDVSPPLDGHFDDREGLSFRRRF